MRAKIAAIAFGSSLLLSAIGPKTTASQDLSGQPDRGQAVAAKVESAPCQTCLAFYSGEDGKTNGQGNPIQELRLYQNGILLERFEAVSGRANSQVRDRNISGLEAPLPNGAYSVARSTVPGTHPEVGGLFLPVHPQFPTGRTYLGLHWDPSFNMANGEDGTSGCIALTNQGDFEKVLQWVKDNQPELLIVNLD